MLILLLKASLIIAALFLFYKLFLERESFFAANRFYLIGCLVFASAIPFISLPKVSEFQGVISPYLSLEIKSQYVDNKYFNAKKGQSVSNEKPNQSINNSTSQSTTSIVLSEEKNAAELLPVWTTALEQKGLLFWLTAFYFFGVIILGINLLIQVLVTFWKAFKSQDKIEDDGFVIVNMKGETEPCSFFNYIFINPESYDFGVYEQIIAHEKIHISKGHFIDILLAEIAIVLLWFNPFVWFLRKEVEKNIEYQTDDTLLLKERAKKESYQLNLVEIASYVKPLAITTNYNQSLIKQRIMKMNAKKSNPFSYWKYAFLLPFLLLLTLLLNEPLNASAVGMQTNIADTGDQHTVKNTENQIIDEPQISTNYEDPLVEIPCKKLLEAIRNNDISQVKELLKTADPNCVDPNPGYDIIKKGGNTWQREKAASPLAAAARTGSVDIAKLLTAAGSNVNLSSNGDGTPLLEAAEFGKLDFIKYLLENGADVNDFSPNKGNGLIASASGGFTETAAFFLSKGLKLDFVSSNQGTALIAAANNGYTETVKFLLGKGASIDLISPNQGNALIAAANNGHTETVKYLVGKGAKVETISPNQGNALIAAANNGHLETIKFLLSKGAKINKVSSNQGNPLIAAANNGHIAVVKFLIEAGAEVNAFTSNQGNALTAASRNGHQQVVRYLISKGVRVNEQSNEHGSALNAAARNGQIETLKLLITEGAEVNIQNDGQGSALNAAARNGQVEVVEILIERGVDVNGQNDGQGSALNAAARNGHTETIELLLEKGADVNLQNDGQGSALNAAARNGHTETIKLLLEKGADVNLQNNGQGSALNAAARNGHLATVKLLIEKGADINKRSDGQGSAMEAAAKNGYQGVVDYLKLKGAN